MRELEQFLPVLQAQGFSVYLKKEDRIPYLEIFYPDFRIMAIDTAMNLAKALKSETTGVVRLHSLDGQSVNFFVYTEDMDISEIASRDLHGTDIDDWLSSVLGSLAPSPAQSNAA